MWAPVIERLRDGFTCVRIDLPGHGESSDASTYDLEAVVSAIRDLCERLELENPILVGHSVGGLIATFYASRFSAAGLVTSDQPLQTEAFLFRLRGMRDQLRSPAFPAIWRAIEAQLGIELIPSDGRKLVEAASNPRQEVVLGYWREPLDVPIPQLQARFTAAICRIDMPFTAVFGDEVGLEYRSWLHAALPSCNVVVFPNAGHFPHLVDPDRFADEVRALARSWVPAP